MLTVRSPGLERTTNYNITVVRVIFAWCKFSRLLCTTYIAKINARPHGFHENFNLVKLFCEATCFWSARAIQWLSHIPFTISSCGLKANMTEKDCFLPICHPRVFLLLTKLYYKLKNSEENQNQEALASSYWTESRNCRGSLFKTFTMLLSSTTVRKSRRQ